MATARSLPEAGASPHQNAGRWRWVAIIAAAVLPYTASLDVPFVFDDLHRIVGSTTIRALWPPTLWLRSNRPLTELTLAVNYAFGGLSVWGYHAVSVALHIAAALMVAQLGRLVLEAAGGGWRSRATSIGWWGALLFAVHPLQTQAVTYISARSELLMAFFYLATVTLALRGFVGPRGRREFFFLGAVFCSALGMASKEVMFTAPLTVAWIDLCVVSGTFRKWVTSLRERRPLYGGLAATWIVAALLLSTASYRGVGADSGISPLRYLATEWGVIVHYVRLFILPAGLVLDYGWPVAERWSSPGVILPMLVVLSAAAFAAWLVHKRRGVWAVWIGWVLAILAPTSTIYPIADPAFEHRMYLPVAGLAILLAMSASELSSRLGARPARRAVGMAGAGVVILLACVAFSRNQVWRDPIRLWQDAARKRPLNARAHYTLGTLLSDDGQLEAAAASLERAVQIDPSYANARTNLGNVLARLGRLDEAANQYRAALELRPESPEDHNNLANVLMSQGKSAEARKHLSLALGLNPRFAEAHNNMGILLAGEGQFAGAVEHFKAALRAKSDFPAAKMNLATVLSRAGRTEEALAEYRSLLRHGYASAQLYYSLAVTLAQAKRVQEAIRVLRDGIEEVGDTPQLNEYIAWLLATSPDPTVRDGREALRFAKRAADSKMGADPSSLDTLAASYAEQGRFAEAVAAAEKALELAREQAREDLAGAIEQRLSLYRAGRPYREE